MNPVEKLQAAIEKLERLRAATEPVRHDSEWVVDYQVGETMRFITVLDSHNGGYDGLIVAEQITSEARAQLIVTLHRTIDAQLAILRSSIAWFERAEQDWPFAATHPGLAEATQKVLSVELALADAILGGDS